ncbi:hypothetical protein PVK06_019536 [Gossypium arboreum]|uniref:Aminotransferase-like plant mobile domain-containing protein n=1 Tax=Gossypium arboreum TaxID=29729 RepID=A0ABR0PJY9_GOSAR|nr:hypothetical protein PVK06_019536 [Gossypium arboreum]
MAGHIQFFFFNFSLTSAKWSPTINGLLLRRPTTTDDHRAPPNTSETAVHRQPPLMISDHSMDPNPNIILNDNNHIAANVHKVNEKKIVLLYLNVTSFEVVAYIQIFELRANLISTLVERLRPETHTFHLPRGEVTITLQDIAVQLGLSINSEIVVGLGIVPDPWGTCEGLLGRVPPNDEE